MSSTTGTSHMMYKRKSLLRAKGSHATTQPMCQDCSAVMFEEDAHKDAL
jgi:hypothetical protein